MPLKKTKQSQDDFWQEYEEKTGEKVLARSLGQYLSGWEEFDNKGWKSIWGLIVATTGGFRFHHFPQRGWFEIFSRNSAAPGEKAFFIPKDKMISAQLIVEKRWWKKIFKSPSPRLIINFRNALDKETEILLDADFIRGDLAESLNL